LPKCEISKKNKGKKAYQRSTAAFFSYCNLVTSFHLSADFKGQLLGKRIIKGIVINPTKEEIFTIGDANAHVNHHRRESFQSEAMVKDSVKIDENLELQTT